MSDSPIPWKATSEMFDDLWAGDTDADIDPATDKVPDTLVTIFEQQRQLMRRVWDKEIGNGSIPTREDEWGHVAGLGPDISYTNRRVQTRIHETFGHLVRELSEAMQHLDASKSWKDSPRPVDVAAFHEEIADALHFFVEFCILAGVDAESLFTGYFAKSLTNFQRIENKY